MSANKRDDQNGNPKDELASALPARRIPSEHEHQDEKSETGEGGNKAKKEQQDASSLLGKRYFQRLWKEASPHDHLMLAFTCIIAFSTFWYMVFGGWQLYEIHAGSIDTHKLAVAAQDQAQTAKSALAS